METDMTTQECIDYCIKHLNENPNEQFAVLEGTNVGEELVLVYRGNPCDCDTDGEPFYEVRVSTLTKTGFQAKKGFVEYHVVNVNKWKA